MRSRRNRPRGAGYAPQGSGTPAGMAVWWGCIGIAGIVVMLVMDTLVARAL
jgi:hypothetical protein